MPASAPIQSAGGSQNATPSSTSPKKISRILPAVFIIFAILIVIFGLLKVSGRLYFDGGIPKLGLPVARVGNEAISKAQVSKFSNECNLGEKEALDFLVDNKVLDKWANDEKIIISGEQTKAETTRIGGKDPKDCKRLAARVNLLRNALLDNLTNFRSGKYIAVNFDRYIETPFAKSDLSAAELTKLNKEERQYADELVNSLNKDLADKKVSFEDAINKVNEDPRFGLNGRYATSVRSGDFSADDYAEKLGLMASPDLRNLADSLKIGEISQPFVVRFDLNLENPEAKPKMVDIRYIILKVERAGSGYQGSGDQLLNETRSKYQVMIY